MMFVKITNVDIIVEGGLVQDGELYIQNGKIAKLGVNLGLTADTVCDARGMTLVPGFIDLHVHGGAGYDFMDHTQEAVDAICRFHSSHGTTSLLATTMTAPMREIKDILCFYRQLSMTAGAEILGLHIEGPFINTSYMGAQNGEWIASPSLVNMNWLLDLAGNGLIRMITLAPELVEEVEVFAYLQQLGIVLSIGHSDLDYHGGFECIRKGVKHATHLGNAMRAFHHRNIGIIGLCMEQPEFTFDVIADGVHVAPEFIRLLSRVCKREQIMLITDAMRAAGLGNGQYELGGQVVNVCNGEARLRSGILAGSILTLDVALKNAMKYTELPLTEAIDYLTINPACKLGVSDRKGSIKVGKDADLVLLDQELNVRATWVRGRLVFKQGDF